MGRCQPRHPKRHAPRRRPHHDVGRPRGHHRRVVRTRRLTEGYTPRPAVGVAQLVELLVVVQVVAGSSPVAHPSWARRCSAGPGCTRSGTRWRATSKAPAGPRGTSQVRSERSRAPKRYLYGSLTRRKSNVWAPPSAARSSACRRARCPCRGARTSDPRRQWAELPPVLRRLCPPLRLGQRGVSPAKHKPLLEVESRGDR